MFSIKKSLSDCSKCDLLENESCIIETNSEKDLSKVEVIFIAENPGKDEIEKEVPLIGKLFRKYFKKYDLHKKKYLLTNTVLCQTLNEDGTTGNPEDKVIDLCKLNCFKIIDICKPKIIVLMGTSAMNAFGLGKSGIVNKRGNFFKWNEFDIFLTVHPSFINRNKSFEEKFENDFLKISETLGSKNISKKISSGSKMKKLKNNGNYSYKIPEKFYSKDYRLIDVQFIYSKNKTLFIFRDKDNKKIYHEENDNYYFYKIDNENIENRKIIPDNKLSLYEIPYKEKNLLDFQKSYDGDLKINVKHSRDYYLNRKVEEVKATNLNILFTDIEIYTGKSREFPNTEDVKYPICMLSYSYHDKLITYLIDLKMLGIKEHKPIDEHFEDGKVIICKNEKELLNNFVRDLKELDPDFITGWHIINFDISYIQNRMIKLGISSKKLSRYGEVYIDGYKEKATIIGMVVLDQLNLYKSFTFGKKENYKLGTIAQLELAQEKLEEGKHFSELFEEDINKAIKYNQRDVTLLVDLDKKLNHIDLQNELRKICKASFDGSVSPFGQLDSLVTSFLKEKNMVSRNTDSYVKSTKFEGAFVKEPNKGIHSWVSDFDFTSLYPSLILTYNIGINTFVMKFKETKNAYLFTYNIDKLPEKFKIVLDPDFENKEIIITKEEFIKKVKDENLISTISGCFFKPHNKELSFYSEILDNLLSSRKIYKDRKFEAKLNKDISLMNFYDTKQLVLKILANALYGVLGNSAFRFFNRDCARTITLSGQEAIKESIIEADHFIEKIKNKDSKKELKSLTEEEMYGDLDRNTPYIITGDTDSLFATFEKIIKETDHEKAINEMQKYCDNLSNYLNNEIIKNLVLRHNVSIEKNKLELKNELMISRGLFLAKKRYSINVISQEGRKTDEIISMGIEVKRSDFSRFTKICLNELLDYILKTEKISITKLMDKVKQKEIMFLNKIKNGLKEISKPISFTKKVSLYKVIPQGVRAMVNWNLIEYDIFVPGTKGYLFKIKGIDPLTAPKKVLERYDKEFTSKGKKLEIIGLPDEELSLPDYYIIDTKAMLKFSWTDRYELLLDPIIKIEKNQICLF